MLTKITNKLLFKKRHNAKKSNALETLEKIKRLTIIQGDQMGFGSAKSLNQIQNIIKCLPATVEAISEKTGLSEVSIRKYFNKAKNIKVFIENNKNKGAYYIALNKKEETKNA